MGKNVLYQFVWADLFWLPVATLATVWAPSTQTTAGGQTKTKTTL